MGVDRGYYLGIYLEIDNIETKDKETYRVNKEGRKFKNGEKFDPILGDKLEVKTKIISSITKAYHVFSEIDDMWSLDADAFFTPAYTEGISDSLNGYVTAILNGSEYNESLDDNNSEHNISFGDIDANKEISDFKKDFKPYLDWLENLNFTYRVKYGVVLYAN